MSKKIRNSAKGQDCQVRLPGVCNFNNETTILAHLNGAGMGLKHSDIHGAYCCSDCHDVLDGRRRFNCTPETLELWHLQGMVRTQKILIEKGLIVLK